MIDLFACTVPGAACLYVTKLNTNGQDGLLQSGVTVTSACRDRCDGSGLQASVTCYGYDFNTQTKECYIFTNKNYQTNAVGTTTGVNHYKKTGSCLATGSVHVVLYHDKY